ncbi:MAG: hypothetical protein H0X51_09515 [Parachlamydiaceae bacterium]|nr:hypothetical protein [Parachlamydiaceae bacterium]
MISSLDIASNRLCISVYHVPERACSGQNAVRCFVEQEEKSQGENKPGELDRSLKALNNATSRLRNLNVIAICTIPFVVTGAAILFSATPQIGLVYLSITSLALATLEFLKWNSLHAIREKAARREGFTPAESRTLIQSNRAGTYAIGFPSFYILTFVARITTLGTAALSGLGLVAGGLIVAYITNKREFVCPVAGCFLFSTILLVSAASKIVFCTMTVICTVSLVAVFVAKISQDRAFTRAVDETVKLTNLLWKIGLTNETYHIAEPLFRECWSHQRPFTDPLRKFLDRGIFEEMPERVLNVFVRWRTERKVDLRNLLLQTYGFGTTSPIRTILDEFKNDLEDAMPVQQ